MTLTGAMAKSGRRLSQLEWRCAAEFIQLEGRSGKNGSTERKLSVVPEEEARKEATEGDS